MNRTSLEPGADVGSGDPGRFDGGGDPERNEQRVRALRWRTLSVGTAALLAAVIGVLLGLASLTAVWRAVLGTNLHVPTQLAGGWAPLPWIALALAAIAVGGLSTATIRQQHAALALLLSIGVAVADVVSCPPTRAPLGLVPTALERMVAAGDQEGARQALEALPPSTAVEYVRAQLAMRDADAAALRRHAPRVLEEADQLANGAGGDEVTRSLLEASVGDLRIDVVAALDRALNGEPMTLAGIETPAGAGYATHWVRLTLRAATATLLIALAFALSTIWRRMCGFVERIESLIDDPDVT